MVPSEPFDADIAGAGQGQFNSVIAAAWAQIINKYATNLTATAVNTSGINENFQLLATNQTTFAFTSGLQYDNANNGDTSVVDAEQFAKIKPLFQLPAGHHHWVVSADSPIQSLKDLTGKKIAGFGTGSGGWDYVRDTLEGAGVTDYQQVEVGPDAALEQLSQGRVDVVMTIASPPNPHLVQYSATNKFRLLAVTDDIVANVQKKYPSFQRAVIPAGTYDGMVNTEDVPTLEEIDVCASQADVPDAVVTHAMNVLFDHLDEFGAAHPGAKRLSLDTALNGITVPLHPGAVAFYESRGIEVPADLRG